MAQPLDQLALRPGPSRCRQSHHHRLAAHAALSHVADLDLPAGGAFSWGKLINFKRLELDWNMEKD